MSASVCVCVSMWHKIFEQVGFKESEYEYVEQPLKKQTRQNLQVQTVMLAGMLMVLLMTANTLMLYSMPASSPVIVQVVVLPGILISSCTPDKRVSQKDTLIQGCGFYSLCPCFWDNLKELSYDHTLSEGRAQIWTNLLGCLVCMSLRNLWAQPSPPTPGQQIDLSALVQSSSWLGPLLKDKKKKEKQNVIIDLTVRILSSPPWHLCRNL